MLPNIHFNILQSALKFISETQIIILIVDDLKFFEFNILGAFLKLINIKSKSGKKWELLEIFI